MIIKIIDEAFELRQAPICTEPFSQVAYKNGLVVTSQLDKVIFSTSAVEQGVKFEDLALIVKNYVTLIPHVEYTGIGINPTSIIRFRGEKSSEDYVIDKFLKIEKGDAKIFSPGLNFSLMTTETNEVCNLKIKSSKRPKGEENRYIIVINANFHHDLKYDMDNKIETIIGAIDLYNSDIDFFQNNVIQMYFKENT